MTVDIAKIDFDKGAGLVPAIVQDADSLQVLMLGYMNAQAIEATLQSGCVTFYSRSRNMLWQKGETSGNILALVDIKIDCDQDTLLVRARPAGPTCHEGTISCFGNEGADGFGFLAELTQTIEARKNADPKKSYTASLLKGPLSRTAQKVGEEGVETVIAALAQSETELVSESADLLYHLMVLLAAKGMSLNDVMSALRDRSH